MGSLPPALEGAYGGGYQSPLSRLNALGNPPDQPTRQAASVLKIIGYPDRYSVAPGETIAFKLSVEEGDWFDARLVRVVHGDCNPEGPGLKFIHLPTAIDGRHPGRRQRIDAGSFMVVDPMPALAQDALTFFAMIWPTRPKLADQTILAQRGLPAMR